MGSESSIPCSGSVRYLVKQQKRAGETYNQLLRKMVDAYEPDESSSDDNSGQSGQELNYER